MSDKPESPNKETDTNDKSTRSVARSAGIVSAFVMISRIFGLIRVQVFARLFGSGFLADSYFVAFRIPNLLRDLFAEGALSVAFVKVFTDYKVNVSEKEAWRLAALMFNCIAVFMSTIVILGIIASPYFVPYLAKGFEGEKIYLTVLMTQIMFPFIMIVSLAAVAMGILNTKGNFAIPASASTAFNIVSIISGVGLAYYLSGGDWVVPDDKSAVADIPAQWAIIGMAGGTVVGGLAQLGIQLPSLWKVGFRFKPLLSFTDKGVKKVLRLMGPAVIGTSAVQVKVLVDQTLVSEVPGGASWLPYAFRLMQFPIGVFGVAIGVAALPTLARLGSENNIGKFRSTLADSLGLVFLMTIPSAVGLIVLGTPIVGLIYQGGAFTEADTMMTSWALTAYSIGLSAYAAIKVLSPSFYALDDAKTPMYVSVASIIVHIAFSYTLLQYFSTIGVSESSPLGFGHVGVALATSIVATLNFLALLFLMRRKIERIELGKIISSFVRISIAAAIMGTVCWFSYKYLNSLFEVKSVTARLIEAFVPIAIGGVTFVVSALLLRVRELDQFISVIRKKLGR